MGLKFACLGLLMIGQPSAALVVLDCQGTLPAWSQSATGFRPLNESSEEFTVEERHAPVLVIGLKPSKPWVRIQLGRPITWSLFRPNYADGIILNIESDGEHRLAVRARGIQTHLTQTLSCTIDDDVRRSGAL